MGYGERASKKKIVIIALSSLVLLVMAAAVSYDIIDKSCHNHQLSGGYVGVSASVKAMRALCQPTYYKEACEKSLEPAKNVSDPIELMKVAFQAAETNTGEVLSKSSVLKETAMDPMAAGALGVCESVLDRAIDELKRSFEKIGEFGLSKMYDYLLDLNTWLSAAVSFHEVCLDAFEETKGDTGDRMRELVQSARELTSNALAMVCELNQVLEKLQIPGVQSNMKQRRLLDIPDDYDYRQTEERRRLISTTDEIPSFVDVASRRLLFERGTAALKPNVVVAQDGSGQFKTINEAIKNVPLKGSQDYIVFIKAGVYKEYVEIPKNMNRVVLIGEGPTKTRISGNKNKVDGVNTMLTATFAVEGESFFAKDMGFENSAGPHKHQAVALRTSGDKAVFYNCHMDGYQDTLYTQSHRQFYRDCTITGTVDFVFGDGQAILQNCKLIVRKPLPGQACMVTAQGRSEKHEANGIILQNCEISAETTFLATKPAIKAYLGRPWKEHSRTLILNSVINGFIAPEGWSAWNATDFGLNTAYYGEYQNSGEGAGTSNRVKWKAIQEITPQIAQSFTPGKFIGGDSWITGYDIPYVSGLMA